MRISDWSSDVCSSDLHCKAGACKAKDETNRQSACETVDASHPGEEQARQDNDLADSARYLGTDPVYEQAIDQPQNCSGQRWHRDHQASLCRIKDQLLFYILSTGAERKSDV